MMMSDRFEPLENGEVISVQHDTQVLFGHRTFRAGELNDSIESHLKAAVDNWNDANNGWFGAEGIECEALRFGSKGWQKGRIRLCLEFCPDEPDLSSHSATSSIPAPSTTPILEIGQPSSSLPTSPKAVSIGHNTSAHNTPDDREVVTTVATNDISSAPTSTVNLLKSEQDTPFVGIATGAGVIGTGVIGAVAVAKISTPVNLSTDAQQPTLELVNTTIEPADFQPDLNVSNDDFNEIAFDFDVNNNNGTMELDLTDLGLDFAEHDLLNFEANGMSDNSQEFLNLQDIGKPENSGMLIDEVWNEMNQGNWPGSN
jgi:KGK domain